MGGRNSLRHHRHRHRNKDRANSEGRDRKIKRVSVEKKTMLPPVDSDSSSDSEYRQPKERSVKKHHKRKRGGSMCTAKIKQRKKHKIEDSTSERNGENTQMCNSKATKRTHRLREKYIYHDSSSTSSSSASDNSSDHSTSSVSDRHKSRSRKTCHSKTSTSKNIAEKVLSKKDKIRSLSMDEIEIPDNIVRKKAERYIGETDNSKLTENENSDRHKSRSRKTHHLENATSKNITEKVLSKKDKVTSESMDVKVDIPGNIVRKKTEHYIGETDNSKLTENIVDNENTDRHKSRSRMAHHLENSTPKNITEKVLSKKDKIISESMDVEVEIPDNIVRKNTERYIGETGNLKFNENIVENENSNLWLKCFGNEKSKNVGLNNGNRKSEQPCNQTILNSRTSSLFGKDEAIDRCIPCEGVSNSETLETKLRQQALENFRMHLFTASQASGSFKYQANLEVESEEATKIRSRLVTIPTLKSSINRANEKKGEQVSHEGGEASDEQIVKLDNDTRLGKSEKESGNDTSGGSFKYQANSEVESEEATKTKSRLVTIPTLKSSINRANEKKGEPVLHEGCEASNEQIVKLDNDTRLGKSEKEIGNDTSGSFKYQANSVVKSEEATKIKSRLVTIPTLKSSINRATEKKGEPVLHAGGESSDKQIVKLDNETRLGKSEKETRNDVGYYYGSGLERRLKDCDKAPSTQQSNRGEINKCADSRNASNCELVDRDVEEKKIKAEGLEGGLHEATMESSLKRVESHASESHLAPKDGDNKSTFQLKTMSVMRGGELVKVNYKVYIPERAIERARKRLKR